MREMPLITLKKMISSEFVLSICLVSKNTLETIVDFIDGRYIDGARSFHQLDIIPTQTKLICIRDG
jgi:hypothetical protein